MRALFLCETPYQVIATAIIVSTELQNADIDVALFDTISNLDRLYKNVEASGIFKTVYKIYLRKNQKRGIARRMAPLCEKIENNINKAYDRIYFSNVNDWQENQIIKKLKAIAARENIESKLLLFEDGFSTYSNYYGNFFNMINRKTLKSFYYKRIYSEYYKIDEIKLFSPELLMWKPDIPVTQIKKISSDDTECVSMLNRMFDYKNMKDVYDKDIIFFEESYCADGIDAGDFPLISNLADEIGKDKIFVKIHPRNPANRFGRTGIKTNTNTEIPWEIIALNIDLKEKILVTIASGSALTSLVNMNTHPKKIIMLMDCDEIDDKKLTPTLHMLRKIASMHSDMVYLPENSEAAISYIKNITQE